MKTTHEIARETAEKAGDIALAVTCEIERLPHVIMAADTMDDVAAIIRGAILAALTAATADLRADKERLDWLLTGKQKVSDQAGWDGTQGQVRVLQQQFASEDGAFCGYEQITTRQAIDAARKQEGKV